MSIVERVNAAVDAALGQRIVGCVILINKDGQEIYARAAGLAAVPSAAGSVRPRSGVCALMM